MKGANLKNLLILPLTGLLGVLGGCYSSYSAEVRNSTSGPVQVTLVKNNASVLAGTTMLAERRLAAGESFTFGPFTLDQRDIAYLRAQNLVNPGPVSESVLRPGGTVLTVENPSGDVRAPVSLRPLN